MNIYPTHSCFDDAIAILILLMKRDGGRLRVKRGDIRIVHAIITPDGVDLAHAWVEKGDKVYFLGIVEGEKVLVEADLAEYLRESRHKLLVKYTLFEAYAEETRTGHYGPWDDRIRSLCLDVRSDSTKREGQVSLEKGRALPGHLLS